MPPVPRVKIAQIVEGSIGVMFDVIRILLPVESNEFDGEENGEKCEEKIPAERKPKPVEGDQHVVAGDLGVEVKVYMNNLIELSRDRLLGKVKLK